MDSHDEWLERIRRRQAMTDEILADNRRGVSRLADIGKGIADSVTSFERPTCPLEDPEPPEAI